MDTRSYGPQHLKFLIVAIVLLVALDRFVLGGTRPYVEEARQEAVQERAETPETQEVFQITARAPGEPRTMKIAKVKPEIKIPETSMYRVPFGPEEPPAWRRNAVPVPAPVPGQPKVVIVIDDMGVSRAYSRQVLEMDGALTLAFLPYAQDVAEMAAKARAHGHELMVHMPMEPMNGDLDTGPIALKTGQSPEEFSAMLEKGLGAFSGYVGINNHMGSRLTQDPKAMEAVMAELKERGLLFLDSRTIASSVAAETAAGAAVPYAVRDVFLDDDPSLDNVRKSLKHTEEIALKYGQAIAIGHPKPNTIAGLKEWLPTLAEKGIALVPISAVVITTPSSSQPPPRGASSVSAASPAPREAPAPQHP